jgi:hypothetical protein
LAAEPGFIAGPFLPETQILSHAFGRGFLFSAPLHRRLGLSLSLRQPWLSDL